MAWIKCSERRPESGTYALAYIPMFKATWVAYFDTGEWFDQTGAPYKNDAVTHWQPLPEPPIAQA
jgi:Protein of unknown function (DUF551)